VGYQIHNLILLERLKVLKNNDHQKIKLNVKDWRLTIFGKPVTTPKELLPLNHPDSPYFERKRKENKK